MSVARHTIYNILGAALPIGVSLITVPAYLKIIGEARFGVMAIVWLFLGYFSIFDMGLGLATSQQVASRCGDPRRELARLFWTALLINFLLGAVGGLVLLPVAHYYFGYLMAGGPGIRSEMLSAVPWLVLAVPLATTTGVLTGVLQGLSKFGRLNVLSAAGTILFQIIPLACAMIWSPNLEVVIPAALGARIITLFLLWRDVRRFVAGGEPVTFDGALATSIIRFGGWVTVSYFVGTLNAMVDRFLIGIMSGPKSVAHYTVPFNLGDRLAIFGNSAGSALFPKFSAMPKDDVTRFSALSERAVMGPMLLVNICAIFAIGPFLNLWVGSEFARSSTTVGQILMAGFWFDSISRVPLYALRGQIRPQTVAKIDLIQVLPCLIVIYTSYILFGLVGVAFGYVFRVVLNYTLLGMKVRSIRYNLLPVSACTALLALSVATAWYPGTHGLPWVLIAAACVAGGGLLAWHIIPPDARFSASRQFSWWRADHAS